MHDNPTFKADLHSHSTVSDGVLTPAEVTKLAHEHGVTLYALTDHDEVSGIASARVQAIALGLNFIAGVEISVTWGAQTIHIVGLNIDESNAGLLTGLAQTRNGRDQRAKDIAIDLDRVGIIGSYEGALTYVSNPDLISRSHFARYLVEQGYAKNTQDAFDKYLTKGKPGYVPHRWASLENAVTWINQAGGVAIIAHPGRYPLTELQHDALITQFIELGGRGIEVFTGSHSAAENQRYIQVAKRYQLLASCGADFHTPNEAHTKFGSLPALPSELTPVWSVF